MNQISSAQKLFPRSQQDIAADYFALRKEYSGTRWVFSEGRNTLNPLSHCDIAWAGALASHAHTEHKGGVGAAILLENGTILTGEQLVAAQNGSEEDRVRAMLLSDDPASGVASGGPRRQSDFLLAVPCEILAYSTEDHEQNQVR